MLSVPVVHTTEEQFYSKYSWCLNPILSIDDLLRRLDDVLKCYPSFSGWQREESKINFYLFACAIATTADDYFAARIMDLSALRSLLPRFRLLLDAAEWVLNKAEWLFEIQQWRVRRWRKRWNRCVHETCALLIADSESEDQQFEILRRVTLSLLAVRLPKGLLARRMRLPEAFRGQDMSHCDVISLIKRFCAAHPVSMRPIVIVGLRTAGAYFAPLMAAYLKMMKWPEVTWFSIRPKTRTTGRERQQLSTLGRGTAQVLVVDDYPATGKTMRLMVDLLGRFNIAAERIAILAPTHHAQPNWTRLAGIEGVLEIFTIQSDELHKTALLSPDSVQSLCQEYYGVSMDVQIMPDEHVDEINRYLAAHSKDGHHVREKRVFKVRLAANGIHQETKKILVKSVGWGWLGYHAYIAGKRLVGFVPHVIGLRNGLLVTDWIDEAAPPRREEVDMTERLASYVAVRSRQLPLTGDCHFDSRNYRWTGSDELLCILRAVYGGYVSRLKASALRKRLHKIVSSLPTLVDGQMRPEEWIHTSTGAYKVDFEHHNFGCAEIDIVDPAHDLAAATLEFRLSKESERRLLETYARLSGDCTASERILLYKILWGTRMMTHAAQAMAAGKQRDRNNDRYQYARNVLVYSMNEFCAGLLAPVKPQWTASLFFIDLDGVFDHDWLGFPHATKSSLHALALLRSRGHAVVLNTGRSVQHVRNYCRAYGFPGGIAEYGSVFIDAVASREIPLIDDSAATQLGLCREAITALSDVFIDPGYEYSIRAYRYKGRVTEGLGIDEVKTVLQNSQFSKLTYIPRQADTLIVQKRTSKGAALRFVREYLGSVSSPATAIGDSLQDVSMLKAVEYAYAPANCAPVIHKLSRKGQCRIVRQSFQNGLLAAARHRLGKDASIPDTEFPKASQISPLSDLMQTLLHVADRGLAVQLLAAFAWWNL